ncbi:MAG: DNA polymerase III subunit beta [Armatimonadetes bacterium CG07_land_8_20_14_0_80_40_9]|nr:MAG: DNA polymerase III subunit beta [Armatimonadetes bacterium CG07_land_8_20_14_0_80_40_9]
MKITCDKGTLKEGIQTVQRAVPLHPTLPILSNLLLEAKGSQLKLVATDLEMSVQCFIPVEVFDEGSITIPVRVIGDLVSNLPEAKVDLEVKEGEMVMKLRCERSSYNMNGLSVEEFPLLPEMGEEGYWEIGQKIFKEMIDKVIFSAASVTEGRAVLTGSLLVIEEGNFKMVATDGHRLSFVSLAVGGLPKEGVSIIVPTRALLELSRILSNQEKEKVKVTISENQVLFNLGSKLVSSRTIEGQFPDYRRVIPSDYKAKWKANVEELRGAMRRAVTMAREGTNTVKIVTEGDQLKISSFAQDVGQGEDLVKIEREGEDLEVAFNVSYLLDALARIESERAEVDLSGELSAAVIKPEGEENCLYVVMPVRVG